MIICRQYLYAWLLYKSCFPFS